MIPFFFAQVERCSGSRALEVARGTERQALLLYGLLEEQLDPAGRANVAAVIDEERAHLVDLTRLKAALGG